MNYLKTLLLLLVTISCTLTPELKVTEYIREMKNKIQNSESFIKTSATEIHSHEQILKKWPTPSGKAALDKMVQSRINMMQFFYRFKEDFRGSPLHDMISVKSNEPNYESTKLMMDQFNQGYSLLESQITNYSLATQELDKELSKKKIFLVDGEVLNTAFLESLNSAKRRIRALKNELIEYSVKNNPKNQKIVENLGLIIEKMENNTFRFQRLYTASIKEIGKIKKFATPGMKSYLWKEKQEGFLRSIDNLENEFKAMALTLN